MFYRREYILSESIHYLCVVYVISWCGSSNLMSVISDFFYLFIFPQLLHGNLSIENFTLSCLNYIITITYIISEPADCWRRPVVNKLTKLTFEISY